MKDGRAVGTYGSFVEAMRQKRVYGQDKNGDLLEISARERGRNWAIDSYDFGELLDPESSTSVLARIPSAIDLIEVGRDRAFLFTMSGVRWLLIERYGIEDYADDDEHARFYFYKERSDGAWVSRDAETLLRNSLWAAAAYLLDHPEYVELTPDPTAVQRANERRRMAGARRLPATTVLKLSRVRRKTQAHSAGGVGSRKRPHDRAAHERRLKDGRVVQVRACRIHDDDVGPPIAVRVRP